MPEKGIVKANDVRNDADIRCLSRREVSMRGKYARIDGERLGSRDRRLDAQIFLPLGTSRALGVSFADAQNSRPRLVTLALLVGLARLRSSSSGTSLNRV